MGGSRTRWTRSAPASIPMIFRLASAGLRTSGGVTRGRAIDQAFGQFQRIPPIAAGGALPAAFLFFPLFPIPRIDNQRLRMATGATLHLSALARSDTFVPSPVHRRSFHACSRLTAKSRAARSVKNPSTSGRVSPL